MNRMVKRVLGAAVVINVMVVVWLFDDWILALLHHL
jgi:hypothetical protein